MPFYAVPTTIIATIRIFAGNPGEAMREARRYAEALGDDTGGFLDGWNDIQREKGGAIIDEVSAFDVEGIDLDEVETLPPRWTVHGQRDLNRAKPGSETHFVGCDDINAHAWAVFETRDGDTELVEDYPTRAAAEAAVSALVSGHPLPAPVWPAINRMVYWMATVEDADDMHASESVWGDWESADDAFGALSPYVTEASANLGIPITWYGPLTLPPAA